MTDAAELARRVIAAIENSAQLADAQAARLRAEGREAEAQRDVEGAFRAWEKVAELRRRHQGTGAPRA